MYVLWAMHAVRVGWWSIMELPGAHISEKNSTNKITPAEIASSQHGYCINTSIYLSEWASSKTRPELERSGHFVLIYTIAEDYRTRTVPRTVRRTSRSRDSTDASAVSDSPAVPQAAIWSHMTKGAAWTTILHEVTSFRRNTLEDMET